MTEEATPQRSGSAEVRPLLERLREAEADYTLTYGNGDLYGEAADHIECLKTVMVAAAEEISLHWAAHCDAEGYGPANLMRRLEEGIPSQYGYTPGAFEALKADNERLREALGVAYGYLWCVNNEPGTPNQCPPEKAAYEARKVLRNLLTHDERGAFINRVLPMVRGGDA